MSALVSIEGLSIDYRIDGGVLPVVRSIDLRIDEGERHGLVGESGSGKSSIALTLTRFLPRGASVRSRRLEVAGRDLRSLGGAALRDYRRRDIGVVYQDPARALDPTARIGAQLAEVHRMNGRVARAAVRAADESLDDVGLPPDLMARRYPHELSGGQQQRAMIALALAGRPRLLILDEPTTAQSGAMRIEILDMIERRRREQGFASLFISHDLATVASWCERATALAPGGETHTVSTEQLLADHPRRDAPVRPPATSSGRPPVLVASRLTVDHGSRRVIDGVDLHLSRGETLAVVGESGSGKTTLGRALAGVAPHGGSVTVDAPASPRPVQMVFQSPESSLNPRRTVRRTLARAISLLAGDETPDQLAARVGLPRNLLDRLPHELSGGQKQRVAIARAFAGTAPIIVCDEPTSALDAAAASDILDLLIDLQDRTGATYVFISHDVAAVRRIAHRVAVMRQGHIEETVSADSFFRGSPNPHSLPVRTAHRRAWIGVDE
ncbi:ABC transporter ATP-binding protein [Agromyces atrinae]|uniref:ABC transporter ATP-binding protein n=1 Tax=Agromyces atrinae TaxID=592376 RepID=A0A4Q2M7A1_9MICO|nr:ABC transporter ATP-binding protein [Agromyces atrinae]NYD67689.1 peptide/nickel transport system ATP-binding protein [Agromyces atrinae]RXZ88114.1 ABC transporter ATP-binding protein [Agromyces atrinae]